jgi:hypothetical protein
MQMSFSQDLSTLTRRTGCDRLEDDMAKVAQSKLCRAIADKRPIRTARRRVITTAVIAVGHNLSIPACGAGSYWLPDDLAPVAESELAVSVADESAVGTAKGAVAVGCRICVGR